MLNHLRLSLQDSEGQGALWPKGVWVGRLEDPAWYSVFGSAHSGDQIGGGETEAGRG